MIAQERLRAAARAAGWLAEYEVRGFEWIADVLCVSGDRFVALEDQRIDNRTLVNRTERYKRSGVHVAWFTPKLRRRKISHLIGVVPIFDANEIETVVSQILTAAGPLPCAIDARRRCELCTYPVSTISSFWCWSCWFRFTAPNTGQLVQPYIHLTDWNRIREMEWAAWQERMKSMPGPAQFRGTR